MSLLLSIRVYYSPGPAVLQSLSSIMRRCPRDVPRFGWACSSYWGEDYKTSMLGAKDDVASFSSKLWWYLLVRYFHTYSS